MNDGGEIGKAFLQIYPTELELKVRHNDRHTIFLDLEMLIGKGKFIYKMFDKRNAFHFHTECHQLQIMYHPLLFIVPFIQNL